MWKLSSLHVLGKTFCFPPFSYSSCCQKCTRAVDKFCREKTVLERRVIKKWYCYQNVGGPTFSTKIWSNILKLHASNHGDIILNLYLSLVSYLHVRTKVFKEPTFREILLPSLRNQKDYVVHMSRKDKDLVGNNIAELTDLGDENLCNLTSNLTN